jgi:hypothetical protein
MEDVGHLPVSSRQTSIKRTLIAVAVIVALGASIVLFKDLSGHDCNRKACSTVTLGYTLNYRWQWHLIVSFWSPQTHLLTLTVYGLRL